jgi:glutaminase
LSLHKQLAQELAAIFGSDADNDDTIPYVKFVEIMLGHESLLQRSFFNKLAIPDWEEFVEFVTETYRELQNVKTGERATYIPELGDQDPNWWGVSIVTVDGQVFNIGDTDREFSIQSCGKPLLYSLVVEDHGYDHVHKYVGKEPSGREFNAFTLNYEGKPHNACINAGAIATAAMYHPELNSSGKYNKMTQGFSKLAGDQKVGFSQAVYLSEKETANRNFALTYFMASEGTFPNTNLEESLDFYFQLCSVEINASKLAAIAATYSKYGTSPLTGERVLTFHTVKRTMQLCLTCGMYDYSGEWAYSTGLPAKSGVSGCVWFVVPSKVGICTFSPPLDEHGNSVRGILFAQKIAAKYSWSVFDSVYRHREPQSIQSAPPTSDSELDR